MNQQSAAQGARQTALVSSNRIPLDQAALAPSAVIEQIKRAMPDLDFERAQNLYRDIKTLFEVPMRNDPLLRSALHSFSLAASVKYDPADKIKIAAHMKSKSGAKEGGQASGRSRNIKKRIIQDEIKVDVQRWRSSRKGISYVAQQAVRKFGDEKKLTVGQVRNWINRGDFGDRKTFL